MKIQEGHNEPTIISSLYSPIDDSKGLENNIVTTKLETESILENIDEFNHYVYNLLKGYLEPLEGDFFDAEYLDKELKVFVEDTLMKTDYSDIDTSDNDYLREFIKHRELLNKVTISLLGKDSITKIHELLGIKISIKRQEQKKKKLEKKVIKSSLLFSNQVSYIIVVLSKFLLGYEPSSEIELLRSAYKLSTMNYPEDLISRQLLHDIVLFLSIGLFQISNKSTITTYLGEEDSESVEENINSKSDMERSLYLKEIEDLNNGRFLYLSGIIINNKSKDLSNQISHTVYSIEPKIIKYKYGLDLKKPLALKFLDSGVIDYFSDLDKWKEQSIVEILLIAPGLFFGNISLDDNDLFKYLLGDLEYEKYESIKNFFGYKKSKGLSCDTLLDIFDSNNWDYFARKDNKSLDATDWNINNNPVNKVLEDSYNNESIIFKKRKVKTKGVANKNEGATQDIRDGEELDKKKELEYTTYLEILKTFTGSLTQRQIYEKLVELGFGRDIHGGGNHCCLFHNKYGFKIPLPGHSMSESIGKGLVSKIKKDLTEHFGRHTINCKN